MFSSCSTKRIRKHTQHDTRRRKLRNKLIFSQATHRRLIAAVFASVCRRFFKYLLWYFCSSAIDPLSACILLGEMASPLLLLTVCWWIVATDDSESLEALDESDNENCCSGFCVKVIRETLIFGEGVNVDVDASLLLVLTLHELLLLTLMLLLLLPMPAFRFIRLSFCTFFFRTR